MRARERGFTVIEALVVVTLMAVAFSGVAVSGIVAVRADTKSHLESAATALAQARLDQLRTLPHDHSAWTAGDHTEEQLAENGTSQTGGLFTRRWAVELDYNGHDALSRVTVTVAWNEGQERSVTVSSLYW